MVAAMAALTTLYSVYHPLTSTKVLNSSSFVEHTRGINASLTMFVILKTRDNNAHIYKISTVSNDQPKRPNIVGMSVVSPLMYSVY